MRQAASFDSSLTHPQRTVLIENGIRAGIAGLTGLTLGPAGMMGA